MAKFTLVSAVTTRNPHQGLITKAYYKIDPSDPLEEPHCIVVFNRWPTVTINAELVEYPLGGVYENKNGRRMDRAVLLCPKTPDGLFCMGYSPAEQASVILRKLVKIEV